MKNTEIHIVGRTYLEVDNIAYLQADENYTRIHLYSGGHVYVATTLGKFEQKLSNFGFIRPNRKTVINLSFISEVNGFKIKLKNSREIAISRRRFNNLNFD